MANKSKTQKSQKVIKQITEAISWILLIVKTQPNTKNETKIYNQIIKKCFIFNGLGISYYKIKKLKNLIENNPYIEYLVDNL
jgi:mevalonate kinase